MSPPRRRPPPLTDPKPRSRGLFTFIGRCAPRCEGEEGPEGAAGRGLGHRLVRKAPGTGGVCQAKSE
ncbi:hypothetical protein SSCG_02212 [Streptomyces clavuligerus]|nr:hypothetical protein SSCG_02212 [Streptomyces clavuligerus]